MARLLNKLSSRTVASMKMPGRHSDGGNLYLVIDKSGAKRWTFLFRWRGPLKEMGLGGINSVPLAQARELAAEARAHLAAGKNPIFLRREAVAAAKAAMTFGACAEELVLSLSAGFRNTKHRQQWRNTLVTYAASLTDLPVDEITTEHVLSVLKPIWTTKAETASRVRGRLEKVLDAAKAKDLRTGENPARWRGHLDHLLPRRQRLQRGHHAALSYADIPAFIAELRQREAVAALALEFLILTASRTSEVVGARWEEIDRTGRIWTVPAARMKSGRPHRVPLVARALDILDTVAGIEDGEFVFPGGRKRKPLSTAAMSALLNRRMGRESVTVHGFRSSFRDWAGEMTNFPREIAEGALAHVVGDATERAYRRGDSIEKRRALMEAWASFIDTSQQDTNVISLARRG